MAEEQQDAPTPEIFKSVGAAFIVIVPEQLLAPLEQSKPQTSLSVALVTNARDGLRGVVSAGSLPYQLASHSAHQRHFDRIYTAERIRSHINVKSGDQPSVARREEALQIAHERMHEFVRSSEGVHLLRDWIVLDLNGHLGSPAVKQAASELLVQTSISTWSVFESAVGAFIIGWINADPRRAIPVLAATELKSYFGKQAVDIDVIEDHGFDLSTSMGDILFRERRLDNLPVIRSVLNALFDDQNIRLALGDNMWLLNQRRHLLTHRRGIVDAEYLRKTGDSAPIGQRLHLSSVDIEMYVSTVQNAIIAIAQAADSLELAK